MFVRANFAETDAVSFQFEGKHLSGRTGDTIAAALLLSGETTLRESYVTRSPRAPFCMIGNCFECLVEVDGVDGVQACLTPLLEGMQIRRSSAPTIKARSK
ncbi:(2Fe-2S)-binding protein [Thalassospira lucentensis]|uniref:(2Fe-2S)-binding protein n=1 Tax=Thalassospira lucentensis TaxID=168935 RepID=UPI003AA7DC17